MPQVQLPFVPEGVTHINANLAFIKEAGRITYFNGNMPIFIHDSDDHRAFKMITAQFSSMGIPSRSRFRVHLEYRRSTSSEPSNVIGSTASKVSMRLGNRVARRY